MSLLSNLLSYSCLNQSPQKQVRSSSLGGRFLYEFETPKVKRKQQSELQSKSVSKLSIFSSNKNQSDSKQRILHRFTHRISMKVRKHYYELFVILQTLKKKNGSLKENRKLNKIQQSAILKFQQIINVALTKKFEKSQKQLYFRMIQQHTKWNYSLTNLSNSVNKFQIRRYFKKIHERANHLESIQLKLQIFATVLKTVTRRHNNNQQDKISAFKNMKRVMKENQRIYEQFDNFKQIQRVEKVFFTTKKEQKKFFQQLSVKTEDNQFVVKSCSPPQHFHKAVSTSVTLQDNFHDISKSYENRTKLQQNYFMFNNREQKLPLVGIRLIPQELGLNEIGDIQDISSIFREYSNNKNIKNVSVIESLSTSGLGSESFYKVDNLISDIGKVHPHHIPTKLSSEQYDQSRGNNSFFGCDAVNFKNSLVCERESIDWEKGPYFKKKIKEAQKERKSFTGFPLKKSDQFTFTSQKNRFPDLPSTQFDKNKYRLKNSLNYPQTSITKPKSINYSGNKQYLLQASLQEPKNPYVGKNETYYDKRRFSLNSSPGYQSLIVYQKREDLLEKCFPIRDIIHRPPTSNSIIQRKPEQMSNSKKFINIYQKLS